MFILCEVISLSCLASFATQNTPPTSNFVVGTSSNLVDYRLMRQPQHIKYLLPTLSPPPNLIPSFIFWGRVVLASPKWKGSSQGNPRFLCASVEKTLKPKFSMLQELQFYQAQIISSAVQGWVLGVLCSETLRSYWKLYRKISFLSIRTLIRRLCTHSILTTWLWHFCFPRFIGERPDSSRVIIPLRIDSSWLGCVLERALHTICSDSERANKA